MTLKTCEHPLPQDPKMYDPESRIPPMCAHQELPIAHSFFLCCPSCRGWKLHKRQPCQSIYSYKNLPSDRCQVSHDKETTFKSCERDYVGDIYWWFHQGECSKSDNSLQQAGSPNVEAESKSNVKQEQEHLDDGLFTHRESPAPFDLAHENMPISNAYRCLDEVRMPGQKYETAYLSFQCGHLGQTIMPKPAFTARPKFDQWPLPLQYHGQGEDNKHLGNRALACGCYTGKVPDVMSGDDAVGYGSGDDKFVWNITSKCSMCSKQDVARTSHSWRHDLDKDVKTFLGRVEPLTTQEDDSASPEIQQARRLTFLEETQFFEHREQYSRTLRGADMEENGALVQELSRYKPKEHDHGAKYFQDGRFTTAVDEPHSAIPKMEDDFPHPGRYS